ncbi:hypothetical protein [Streptomyces sp. NPDC031705]|uniref:hypothetical protein n=1 Tax=Streptomyces sp. NPDC031705 TaxID=3155729 RepID=UPI0033CA14EF
MGEMIGGGFSAFRRYWKPLVGIMLSVQGAGLLIVAAAIGIAVMAVRSRFSAVFDLPPGERPTGEDVTTVVLAFVPAGVLLLVTLLLGAALISALCPAVAQEAVLGRPATFGAMWRRCWSRLPSVLGVLALIGLIAGGPVLLLYAIGLPLVVLSADSSEPPAGLFLLLAGVMAWMPVSTWLMTRFSFAPAVAVFEGLGPVAALRRSARLVRDAWWRVFGITLLAYLVGMAVGYAIQLPFGFVGMLGLFPAMFEAGSGDGDLGMVVSGIVVYAVSLLIGSMVSALFQLGYPQLVVALLYVDQRMRREDLAAALIASAVPAQAAPGRTAGP